MKEFPKYERCSAPVCSLDPDWRERTQLDCEPVCFYLLEALKDGGTARIREGTPEGMATKVLAVLEELSLRHGHGYIRSRLRRAAKTGSRIAAGGRLFKNRGRTT